MKFVILRHHKTRQTARQTPKRQEASWASCLRLSKKSRPDDMRVRSGHIQGNFALRVCEPVRASARFGAKFCPQGAAAPSASSGRSSEGAAGAALRFSQAPTVARRENRLVCGQKWVPPGAWRFCDTLRQEASWASCLGVLLLNACYSVKTLRGPIPAHGPYRSTCSKRFAEIRYASKSKTP